jgi:hypothetical protein
MGAVVKGTETVKEGGGGVGNLGYPSGAQQKCEPDRLDVERQPSHSKVHSTSVIPNTGNRRTRNSNFIIRSLFRLAYLTNLKYVPI